MVGDVWKHYRYILYKISVETVERKMEVDHITILRQVDPESKQNPMCLNFSPNVPVICL